MKKLYFLFMVLCAAVTVGAVEVEGENNMIKMVTYFPVPYVTYNDLNVFGRCDVGGYEGCNMTVGGIVKLDPSLPRFGGTNRDTDFKTGILTVLGGTLDLRAPTSISAPFLYTRKILVGASEVSGRSSFTFNHNVEITQFYPREMDITAASRANIKTLYLNGKLFPQCSAPRMHWRYLRIDGKKGVFLECGG